MKRPTLKALAEQSGCSRRTLFRVLRGDPCVKPATREALVRDRGTLYTVMEAKAGKMELSLSQVWGGIGLAHDPLADRYIVEKIVRTQMALAGAKRSTRLQARTEELREILTALLRAREEWRHANRRTN